MKRSKFSEDQVAYALRQAEAGTPVGDVCRQLGVSEATFYAWKKKYAHLGVSELRRLGQLEDENARLKRVVADPHARQTHAGGGATKNRLRPARRRELAGWFQRGSLSWTHLECSPKFCSPGGA
jgi:putative transposase